MATPSHRSISRALVHEGAVFDAHADSLQRALDLGHDLGTLTDGHFDLVRGRRGGLGAQVFVCWVDPAFMAADRGGAARRTDALLGEFHALLERHPEKIAWCGNGSHLQGVRSQGLIAGIPGIEGGHSIEEDLRKLEHFFDHGVRVMTLVWNNHLPWIRSCQEGAGAGVPAGLSRFGREVVQHMNELGMLIDLAHAGERSFFDALEVSRVPVLASHSGCSAQNSHPRNLSDDQLSALAQAGGVACMVFCTPFLDVTAQAAERAARKLPSYRSLRGENETALFLAQSQYLQGQLEPLPLQRFTDHLLHAVEVCGIEHVGIGSDFDGIQRTPEGLEDAAAYPNLMDALVDLGFGLEDLRLLMGANVARVFAAATGPETRAYTAPLVAYS